MMRTPALMKQYLLVVLALDLTIVTEHVSAQLQYQCMSCYRLVTVDETGAGLMRDVQRKCGRCKLRDAIDLGVAEEGELPTETIDRICASASMLEKRGIHYVFFEDGTMLDLRHFNSTACVEGYAGEWGR